VTFLVCLAFGVAAVVGGDDVGDNGGDVAVAVGDVEEVF